MALTGGNSALGFYRTAAQAGSIAEAVLGVALELPGPAVLAVPGAVSLIVVRDTLGTMTNVQVNRSPEEFDIRRNDRLPAYLVDVYDEFGDQLDLSAASSQVFTLRTQDGTLKVNRQAATIIAGPDGSTISRLSYAWAAVDTDTAGRFTAEFEVTFPGSLPRTFPASKKTRLVVHINDDLDAT